MSPTLVVWMTRDGKDRFHVCEDRQEAEIVYESLICDDRVYTCSICAVIKSTDYEPMEGLK